MEEYMVKIAVSNDDETTKQVSLQPMQTGTPNPNCPPLAPNGLSVDPDYLRRNRGWAREDLYDRPAHQYTTTPDVQ